MMFVTVTAFGFGAFPATHESLEARNLTVAKKVRQEAIKRYRAGGYRVGESLITGSMSKDHRGCAVTVELRSRWTA